MNQEFTFNFDMDAYPNNNDFSNFGLFNQPSCFNIEDMDKPQEKAHNDLDSAKNYKSTTNESIDSEREINNYQFDDLSPIVVPFIDNSPNLNELERIVSEQINEKGYNNVVLDCLDMSTEDDFEDEPSEIIRKKQKKSRTQIRALKSEFKKQPYWTKRFMKRFAKKIGLTMNQVYKWHWDQTNKSKGV